MIFRTVFDGCRNMVAPQKWRHEKAQQQVTPERKSMMKKEVSPMGIEPFYEARSCKFVGRSCRIPCSAWKYSFWKTFEKFMQQHCTRNIELDVRTNETTIHILWNPFFAFKKSSSIEQVKGVSPKYSWCAFLSFCYQIRNWWFQCTIYRRILTE